MEHKKEIKSKEKKCTSCDKVVPQYFKTCTINNEKMKIVKEKTAATKQKQKDNRLKKQQEKKYSAEGLKKKMQLFVRLYGADECCSCKKNFEQHGLTINGGHFQVRSKQSTAFLVTNISKQCARCNANGGEQYGHSFHLDEYWEQGTAKKMLELSKKVYQSSFAERKEMYDYADYLIDIYPANNMSASEKKSVMLMMHQWQSNQEWYKNIK
jgi:hypothetical protein